MARKQSISLDGGVLGLVAGVPWWASALLAVLLYAVLRGVAPDTGEVLQYLLPLACLAVAAGSVFLRRQREGVAPTDLGANADPLSRMSWREFESLMGDAFRMQGYQVVETATGAAAAGAAEMFLRKDRQTFLVQCKHWKASKVDATVVKDMFAAMSARSAVGGFVVTSGRFTREAVACAKGSTLQLIAGPALVALIVKAQAARATAKASDPAAGPPVPLDTAMAATSPITTASPANDAPRMSPVCEKCGSDMRLRTAKRGRHAGTRFWGCTDAECKSVKRIA